MDQPYLTLGDMLTFIGLIIAGLQFLKPRYQLIWKLTNNFLKFAAISLLIIGYFLPLTSILIPNKDKIIWDGLSLSHSLEILGFLVITVGLTIVIYIYSNFNRSHLLIKIPKFKISFFKHPKKNWRSIQIQITRTKIITTHSANKFRDITSKFLIRGDLEEVVEIIFYNLPSLVPSALQYQPKRFKVEPDNEKKPAKQDGSNYAFEILLQLLTDEAVMRHICTSNYPFLHNLVILENENNIYGYSELANVLYDNVVEHLVLNQNSLLYKQKDSHKGTARFANIYDLLTDPRITEKYRIIPSMLTYHVSKTDVPLDKYVDVLLRLLKKMVESYKEKPGNAKLLDNIRLVFDQLIGDSGVTRKLAYDDEAIESYSNNVLKSTAYKVFSQIELVMTTDLLFRDDDPDIFKTNDAELKAENQRATYDQTTLTGLMAHKVYELIEDLSIFYRDTTDPDEKLRMQVFSYIYIRSNTPVSKRYKELLWERLFDKAVDGNFEKYSTNIEGYYPNVFRFIMSYLIPFDTQLDLADMAQKNRLKHIMANELKDALLKGKRMRNKEQDPMRVALLPPSVKAKISRDKKTIKYYYVNSKGKESLINLKAESTVEAQPKVTTKKKKKRK